MTTPGGGFEYSSDGESVVAKLSIDIPQEGLQSLREMTTETNRYRVELEAANRMGKDFVEYLRQLPQIQAQVAQAQKEIVEQLQRTIDVQKQMLQPGGAGNGSYQTGTAEIASAQSSRAPSLSDVSTALGNKDGRTLLRAESASSTRAGLTAINPHEDAITQADSRAALRKAAQESQQAKSDPGGKPKSPPIDHEEKGVGYDEMRAKISGSTGPLSAIMNELQAGGGGSAGSLLSLLGRGVGSAGAEGGILSSLGLGGAAGPVAAGLAAAGAGMWAFQEGGQMVEGYRQMGQARGGGLGEGLGYEMAIRSMALNPFLSTDQARKIVQQGLSEGYTGKEFDTATQFVAENLKSMNVDISTSFSLMKKNILEGGMTVPGVQASIQDLAAISAQGGYRSVPDLVAGYTGNSQAMLAAGVPAAVADRSAKEAAAMFNNIPVLAGEGDEISQVAQSNPELLYLGARLTGQQIEPGSLPNTMAQQMPDGGKGAIWAIIKQRAQMALQGARNRRQAVGGFQNFLKAMPGLSNLKAAHDFKAAEAMFNQALGGDPIGDSQKANEQATQENTSVKTRTTAEQNWAEMAGTGVALGKRAWEIGKDIVTGHFGDIFSQEQVQRQDDTLANELYGSSEAYIPRMDALVNAYGVHGVEVVDESGKASGFDPDNRGQLDAISSGKYKVQVKGGSPFPLAELPNQTGEDLKKTLQQNYGMPNAGGGNNNVSVQGSVQINVNPPEMAKALGINQGQSIQLSPNKVQAMQGWGNGQTNMPVPGY